MVIGLYIQLIPAPANQSYNNLTKVKIIKSSSPNHFNSMSLTFYPHTQSNKNVNIILSAGKIDWLQLLPPVT